MGMLKARKTNTHALKQNLKTWEDGLGVWVISEVCANFSKALDGSCSA